MEGWLSLSRLNHCLPGREAHPEIVQGTTELHRLPPRIGEIFGVRLYLIYQ